MAWRGSFLRSFMSATRTPAFRSLPGGILFPPPQFSSPPRSRFSFSNPRTLGELGCTQSLLSSYTVGALLTSLTWLSTHKRSVNFTMVPLMMASSILLVSLIVIRIVLVVFLVKTMVSYILVLVCFLYLAALGRITSRAMK